MSLHQVTSQRRHYNQEKHQIFEKHLNLTGFSKKSYQKQNQVLKINVDTSDDEQVLANLVLYMPTKLTRQPNR